MAFRIVTVPEDVCEEARSTRRSPGYGYPAHREIASGYGPCRLCLEPFQTGVDRRLLFTYDPFFELEPFPLPGPIFVHERSCAVYSPEDQYPNSLRFLPVTMNAYGRGRQLMEVRHVAADGAAEQAIDDLLTSPEVDYIHARNTDAGCYLFRVEPFQKLPEGGLR